MPNYTTNYKLIKPTEDEHYHIDDFNRNADMIDEALTGPVGCIKSFGFNPGLGPNWLHWNGQYVSRHTSPALFSLPAFRDYYWGSRFDYGSFGTGDNSYTIAHTWCEGFGLFAGFTKDGKFRSSPDGKTWTNHPGISGTNTYNSASMAYSPTRNRAVVLSRASGTNGAAILYYTDDGKTWKPCTFTNRSSVGQILWVDHLHQFIGYAGEYIYQSNDGITFTNAAFPSRHSVSPVVYIKSKNILVGNYAISPPNVFASHSLRYSENGTSWTDASHDFPSVANQPYSVFYIPEMDEVLAFHYRTSTVSNDDIFLNPSRIGKSKDGKTWVSYQSNVNGFWLNNIFWYPDMGGLLAVGGTLKNSSGEGALWQSSDGGITWKASGFDPRANDNNSTSYPRIVKEIEPSYSPSLKRWIVTICTASNQYTIATMGDTFPLGNDPGKLSYIRRA